jgi:hypothetical protein
MIWDKVGVWTATPAIRPANWPQAYDTEEWFVMLSNSGHQDVKAGISSLVMLTAWEIWRERNNRIFNKVSKSPDQTFQAIQEEAKVWIRAGNIGVELVLRHHQQMLLVDSINM